MTPKSHPRLAPAVIVHGLDDAQAALAVGRPVTLLSAPGAALYAGCLWWTALVAEARAGSPSVESSDILDCADAPGHALAAIRIGQPAIILDEQAPGFAAVAAIAEAQGCMTAARAAPGTRSGRARRPPAARRLAGVGVTPARILGYHPPDHRPGRSKEASVQATQTVRTMLGWHESLGRTTFQHPEKGAVQMLAKITDIFQGKA